MPIRFKCQHCGKPVKAPDGAQGKKSRCPQCNQVISVPQASDPSLAAAEPKAAPRSQAARPQTARPAGARPAQTSRPAAPRKAAPQANAPLGIDDLLGDLPPAQSSLGVDDLLGGDAGPAGAGLGGLGGGIGDLLDEASYDMGTTQALPDRPAPNPYLAPASGSGKRKGGSSGNRNGPAWEGDGATVGSYISTLIAGYTNPSRFFRTMVRDSGVGAPLMFAVATYFITAIAQGVYAFLLSSGDSGMPGENNAAMAGGFAIGYVIGVGVCGTVLVMLGLLIGGAFIHLGVLVTGGSKFGIEPSVRAVAYASGCSGVLQLIPVVGVYLAMFANVPFVVLGIARLHEMPVWRAILVVILPYAILGGVAFALLFSLFFAMDSATSPQFGPVE